MCNTTFNLPSALYNVGIGTLCLMVPGIGYSGPQSSGGMKSVNVKFEIHALFLEYIQQTSQSKLRVRCERHNEKQFLEENKNSN